MWVKQPQNLCIFDPDFGSKPQNDYCLSPKADTYESPKHLAGACLALFMSTTSCKLASCAENSIQQDGIIYTRIFCVMTRALGKTCLPSSLTCPQKLFLCSGHHRFADRISFSGSSCWTYLVAISMHTMGWIYNALILLIFLRQGLWLERGCNLLSASCQHTCLLWAFLGYNY